MFILRTTTDDDCGPDFSSCMALDPSSTSDQAPEVSNGHDMTTNSTSAHQRQQFDARNFIGLIIATTVIVFGLCVWRVRILWKTREREARRERKEREVRGTEKGERAQKIVDDAMRWTMGTDGQEVARPEKALKIGHQYGEGWKTTNSAPWRDKEQRELPNSLWGANQGLNVIYISGTNSPIEKNGESEMFELSLRD
jgi:hypothetical protein